MYETNKRVKEILKRQINEVIDKGDISPNELCCVKDSYEILQAISTIEAMDSGAYETSRGRSMHYPDSRWDDFSWDDSSDARGRGRDGRFMSKANDGRRNTSRHSAKDKMIASLEKEMNNADSEYERQEIMEEIRRLRARND